ncbi:MAG: translation elongation factor Ts, partial [Chloroflexi bacterium]|nr:translation elongation factor Ts [Chloroflexota bacterium]
VDAASVSAADLEPVKEEFRKQALAEGKPAHVVDKIVEGKISKYYQEICLLEQPFIKNEDVTIGQMLKEAIASIGENIVIRRFIRYELGETN